MALLREGHQGTKLSVEELAKVAAWIDLMVPYCGDYLEANAWNEEEMRKYVRFAEKRRYMEKIEAENIAEMLREAPLN